MFFCGISTVWKASEKEQVQDRFQIPTVISKQKINFPCEDLFSARERKWISLPKSSPAECCAGLLRTGSHLLSFSAYLVTCAQSLACLVLRKQPTLTASTFFGGVWSSIFYECSCISEKIESWFFSLNLCHICFVLSPWEDGSRISSPLKFNFQRKKKEKKKWMFGNQWKFIFHLCVCWCLCSVLTISGNLFPHLSLSNTSHILLQQSQI